MYRDLVSSHTPRASTHPRPPHHIRHQLRHPLRRRRHPNGIDTRDLWVLPGVRVPKRLSVHPFRGRGRRSEGVVVMGCWGLDGQGLGGGGSRLRDVGVGLADGGRERLRGGQVGSGGGGRGRRRGRRTVDRIRRIVNRVRSWVAGKGSWVAGKGRWAGERRERARNRNRTIVSAHQAGFERRDCCIQID